ncbi:MAG: PQQ-binding-like beta-propeller repeat protein, partial [Pirellulales bacterium]
TGRIVWKDDLPRDSILEYQPGSPLVAEINGRAQVIMGQGDGWLRSFDPATGAVLWKFDMNPKTTKWELGAGENARNMIPATPVLHDNRVYIANGLGLHYGARPGRLCCIDPKCRGDISAELAVDTQGRQIAHRTIQAVDVSRGEKAIANPNSGLRWEYTTSTANAEQRMHGMIANVAIAAGLAIAPDVDGYVHCLHAKTGKSYWTYDAMATLYASPLIVDGHIYVADDDGDVAILRLSADPEVALPGGKPIAEINMGSSVFCSPIFANGTLYIATRSRLFAIHNEGGRVSPHRPMPGR